MPGNGELRFDPELNSRPDYWKYRAAPRPDSKYRSLFYDNDKDTVAKAVAGLTVGSILASGASLAAVCHEPYLALHQRFTLGKLAEKFTKFGVPFIAAGVTYGVTVGLATNIRKKEDPLNHFAAGAASSVIFTNFFSKSARMKVVVGVATGLACAAIKLGKQNGESMLWMGGGDTRGTNASFKDYRHALLGGRRNPEGSDDADKDTAWADGTVHSRYQYP